MKVASLGHQEGDTCNRLHHLAPCQGVIQLEPVENCSCHISPPCSQCTSPRLFCSECDWHEKNDIVVNDQIININPATHEWKLLGVRTLDPTKLDYHCKTHTHSSMIKDGVYPLNMSKDDVEKAVRGTFGGRFDYFGGGKFKYVAYTD